MEGPHGKKTALSRDQSSLRPRPRAFAPPLWLRSSGTHEYASQGKIFKGAGATRTPLTGAACPAPVLSPRLGTLRSCPSLRAETPPACRTSCLIKSVSSRTCSRPRLPRLRWGPVGAAAAEPTRGAQKDPLESPAQRGLGRARPSGGWSSPAAASGSSEAAADYASRRAPRGRCSSEARGAANWRRVPPEPPGAGGQRAPGHGLGPVAPAGTYTRGPGSCLLGLDRLLGYLVVPGKCPPSLGLLQGRRGHWGPEGHVGRGLETKPEAGLVHLPGTLGLLLKLLGSPTWPEGTVIQRISKKFWSG